MKKSFALGMFLTSAVLVAAALFLSNRAPEQDGPKLQYVYMVRVDPAQGGPGYICAELPVCVDGVLVRIQDIRETQPLYVSRSMPLLITPSDKPMDVEDLRRKLLEPIPQTQEAHGPQPAPNKG